MANAHRQRETSRSGGFGLIEVVFAVVLSSLGVLAAATASLTIGSQARLAGWDTDQALTGRSALETVGRAGYVGVASGRSSVILGRRSYAFTQTVTAPAPRLKHVRVTVAPRVVGAPTAFETRLAQPRPLPAAP